MTTAAHSDDHVDQRRWLVLAVLCLSLLIIGVGNSSLNVAIPTLSRVLHATTSQLQWAVAGYALVFAGLLFTTGAIGDRFGRKGTLQAGLALFLVAALVATASTAMWQIIVCRLVMGAGGALIMPSTLSIIINVFPPRERPKAIAIWAAVTGVSGILGPLTSGLLLGHFWYGSIFLVNVPIVTIALVAGAFIVPRSRDPEQAAFDPVGALLSISGVSLFVFGLIEAPQKGWAGTTPLVAFVVAGALLASFVAWELRVDQPMLDMRYFRDPAFSVATGGLVLVFLSVFGIFFLFTQYLQLVRGFSPVGAAIRLLPVPIAVIAVSPLTPRLTTRFGAHRVVAAGMSLIGVGFLEMSALGLHSTYAGMMVGIAVAHVGFALTMSPMTSSIMSSVPTRRSGAGSAMNDTSRELAAALGVAVFGSLAATRFASGMHQVTGSLAVPARRAAEASLAGALRTASTLAGDARRHFVAIADHAFLNGFHTVALAAGTLASAAAVLVLRKLPHVADHIRTEADHILATEPAAMALDVARVAP
jgi:EmrB/QacA subfamily drug resistance transporter